MKTYKHQILSLIYASTLCILSTGCDEMKKEVDLKIASFPPKLCVSAILDGADSTFTILISEGRALADYKQPRLPEVENKRNGEIRLYEDDRLILSEAGLFDLRQQNAGDTYYGIMSVGPQYGHRFKTSLPTSSGSVYRLEVAVDGYKTVTSTSKMPFPPDVTATIDTTVIVKKNTIKDYSSLGATVHGGQPKSQLHLWPVALRWGARENTRNYYALDMRIKKTMLEGLSFSGNSFVENCGVIVTELSKLQDNPEVEIYEAQEIDFEGPSRSYDAYRFALLIMSDMSFTNNHTSLTLYKDSTIFNTREEYQPAGYLHAIIHNVLILRVRQITEATYRYYRSLTQQSQGVDFYTEPYIITGNIENGYGGFTVSNAVNFQLLEYQTQYYYEAYPE